MFLKELYLYQFKNIEEAELSLSPAINFLCGFNGVGKTNILDAVNYLSFTKSFINSTDTENISYGKDYFHLRGNYNSNQSVEEYSCIVKKEGRKHFRHFQKEYPKMSAHIGIIPLVIISPLDHFIITEGSEFRRKLIDTTISQFDKYYLGHLIQYNKLLKQRNALLKNDDGRSHSEKIEMLEIFNEQLEKPAYYIYKLRNDFMEHITPFFLANYQELAQKKEENIQLVYQSQLAEKSIKALLQENIKKDIQSETTTAGIHKDDILFFLNQKPIRYSASQGQQKTYLTALKLSILQYINSQTQISPILLLDDIFDKLDEHRVLNLLELVSKRNSQVFITDTNYDRIKKISEHNSGDFCIFEVINGQCFRK
jgi:DNA replication and repair protein RecF